MTVKKETEQEHTLHKPITVKAEKGKMMNIPCAECGNNMTLPNNTPPSPNGYACEKCSKKLMLE